MICNGHYYKEWINQESAFPSLGIYLTVCVILQLVLSIIIELAKRKYDHTNQHQHSPLNDQNHVNYGNMAHIILVFSNFGFAEVLMILMKTTPPEMLREHPNNIIIFLINHFMPAFIFYQTVLIFLTGNKTLRMYVKSIFFKNDVYPLEE